MTKEQLKEKYGDEVVMVIDAKEQIDPRMKEGYTGLDYLIYSYARIHYFTYYDVLDTILKPMLRCEAEMNPQFRQVIPYGVVIHEDTGDILTTFRRGGDERLLGKVSIGTGGHMQQGEKMEECLYREMLEEVGLRKKEVVSVCPYGIICMSSSQVDRVHLGVVCKVVTKRRDLASKESDTLEAAFLPFEEIATHGKKGRLEGWSEKILPYFAPGYKDDNRFRTCVNFDRLENKEEKK